MPYWSYPLAAILAYLAGSPPTGYLVAKAKGVDIRAHGSGNIGATNVFRVLGRTAGIFVLLADAAKGALAVLLIPGWVAGLAQDPAAIHHLAVVAALGAVLGHNYTCWLGFKGGKGIATSAGVLGALVPWSLVAILTVWLIVFSLSRYVSLASMAAAASLPVATFLTIDDWPRRILSVVVGALALWKHRPNLRRILNGTENRFGKKPAILPTASS